MPLMERIVQIFTSDGDLIVDPFFGSGTLLVAAQSLGRKWIGSDINEMAQQITKKRLENICVNYPEHYFSGIAQDLRLLRHHSQFKVKRVLSISSITKTTF
ncbi:MAG: site-specific DNA-methyltransferase [Chloroflexi bacterium]|nr:site-specific DNA-methyltransferase [Chloroflexota bacterium]